MPERKALPRLRLAGRIMLLLLVAGGAGFMVAHRSNFDADALAHAVTALPAAPLCFILLHIVASLIFVPRTVLAVAAGAAFGLWMGTLWAVLGSLAGAIAGFLLARYVNSGVVDLESMKRFGPILLRAERGGWRAVAALRLVPVIPHSLANYALGLTRLNLGAYALGSLLGQLPMTVACAEFGAAGEHIAAGKAGWIAPTLIGLGALAVSLLLPRLVARSPKLAVIPPSRSASSQSENEADHAKRRRRR
jgi:uncharacterized membrane protein YdjX (TVP38/TMEM64 family)